MQLNMISVCPWKKSLVYLGTGLHNIIIMYRKVAGLKIIFSGIPEMSQFQTARVGSGFLEWPASILLCDSGFLGLYYVLQSWGFWIPSEKFLWFQGPDFSSLLSWDKWFVSMLRLKLQWFITGVLFLPTRKHSLPFNCAHSKIRGFAFITEKQLKSVFLG